MLAFAAGSVNAIAFMACQRFVTHVTGTVSQIGMDVANLWLLFDYLLVLACFVAGAMASVLAIDGRHHRGQRPLYALPLIVVSVVLAAAALFGALGAFGPFAGSVEQPSDFVFLSLLAFAMGLQNAAVATSTGLVVRTTHMTGPATDLGLHLANALYTTGEARRVALRSAALRAGKIFAFAAGSAAAIPLVGAFAYGALLLPAAVVLGATALSFLPASVSQPTLARA